MTQTILVPLDGSALAAAALPVAARLACEMHASITLVSVGAVPESAAQAQDERAELEAELQDAARRLGPSVPVRTRVELLGDPARGILQAAQEEHADLIVMSTHGRSGLSELVEGSVADEVLRSAHIPVTLVRPRAA
jgi:nucleotide-binding universal stress UspA family protein